MCILEMQPNVYVTGLDCDELRFIRFGKTLISYLFEYTWTSIIRNRLNTALDTRLNMLAV